MRTFDYTAIGILILCTLAGTQAFFVETAVAETAQVVAPNATPTEDEVDLLSLQD